MSSKNTTPLLFFSLFLVIPGAALLFIGIFKHDITSAFLSPLLIVAGLIMFGKFYKETTSQPEEEPEQ